MCHYDHVIISLVHVYHLLALLLLGAAPPAPAILESAVAASRTAVAAENAIVHSRYQLDRGRGQTIANDA